MWRRLLGESAPVPSQCTFPSPLWPRVSQQTCLGWIRLIHWGTSYTRTPETWFLFLATLGELPLFSSLYSRGETHSLTLSSLIAFGKSFNVCALDTFYLSGFLKTLRSLTSLHLIFHLRCAIKTIWCNGKEDLILKLLYVTLCMYVCNSHSFTQMTKTAYHNTWQYLSLTSLEAKVPSKKTHSQQRKSSQHILQISGTWKQRAGNSFMTAGV